MSNIPNLDYKTLENRYTPLSPQGINAIVDNINKLTEILDRHTEGTDYRHESRHIVYSELKDVYSILYILKNRVNQLVGSVSTIAYSTDKLVENTEDLLIDANNLTAIKINGLEGNVKLVGTLGSDIMIGVAMDRNDISIANTEPVEVVSNY